MDLSALGNQPISSENRAGVEVRHDRAFEELQAEMDKLFSPVAASPVDWDKVCRLATDILKDRSKDLLVASYLAVALIHTRGHNGYAAGLKIYLELIENFWEEMCPQKNRLRARIRILEWWLEKSHSALQQVEDLSFPNDQLDEIQEILNQLGHFLSMNLDNSPSLVPIMECLHAFRAETDRAMETEAPVQVCTVRSENAPTAAAAHQPEVPLDTAVSQPLCSAQDAGAALSDALMKVSEASFCLWQQDLSNPHPYRLMRQTAWNCLKELPLTTKGRTRIAPPASHLKKMYADLRTAGETESLLKAAETRQPQYIFWIDLSFFAAEALLRLGSRFEKARDAVCQETALLIHRLPGLEVLSFSDGTPFAAPDTRQWLKGIALQTARVDLSPQVTTESVTEAEAGTLKGDLIAEVEQLVGAGKLMEALDIFQQRLGTTSSRRDNLLWRLSLSRTLVDIGESRLALPHLEQVLDDISRHGLEQYDPSLALRGLKLAWLAFDIQPEQKFKDQAQAVLHQIGRLDMPEMARLTRS